MPILNYTTLIAVDKTVGEIMGMLRRAGADIRLWRPSSWPEIEQTLKALPEGRGAAEGR